MSQDYTLNDWLQILLLLVGMPFIAALGAALGLIGRIRQGGFLPSTISGLTGAAIASAVLYLGLWTLCLESTINPNIFLEIYESGYQQHISIACMIAAFSLALLWSIRWRRHNAPKPTTRITISIRSALLIQFLSLLCVGSWCGLRLLVLQSADPEAMTLRSWQSRGWELNSGKSLALSGVVLSPTEIKAAMSRENLADISNYPQINSLNLAACDLSKVDMTPLASAKNLRTITFTNSKINRLFLRDIFQLQQLAEVGLEDLTTVRPTLTNLARLPNLTKFHADNLNVEREDFRRLLSHSQLQSIVLNKLLIYHEGKSIQYQEDHPLDCQAGKPIDQWPAAARIISINGCNLTLDDLKPIGKLRSLVDLQLGDSPASDSIWEHLKGLNQLQNLSFRNQEITIRGYKLIAQKLQPRTLHIKDGELPRGASTLLGQMPKLESLHLTGVILSAEDIGALSESTTLGELRITSPGLSERTLLMLAHIPTLHRLHYPSFRGCRTFESWFAQERHRLSLPQTKLVLNHTIEANGVTTLVIP